MPAVSASTPALRAPGALGLSRAWAVALAAFAVSRALVLVAGACAHALWGDRPRMAVFDPGGLTRPFADWRDHLVAPLGAWDSVWYLVIANDGYAGDGPREAFFPLYPLLVDVADTVVRPQVVAGALVSALLGVIALALLHRLAELELDARSADLAVWMVALFPVSFFLSAAYSESLFLALSVGAVLAARTERWPAAAACAAPASATRSAGVVLVLALLLAWWAGARRPRDLGWLACAPLGLAAFSASLALGGGDPLAPLTAQAEWYREFAGPFAGAWDGAAAALRGGVHDIALFATLVVAVPAVVGALRRLPPLYGAYAVAALALPLSWPVEPQPLMSLPRFVLVLFPLALWAGWWLARGAAGRRVAVLGASGAGLVVCTALFATWHWVA
jgi:hypothetical protein